jgi:hypothetical protein
MSARITCRRHNLPVDVEQVVGSFVVEIGFRQAWPFLGFCDNRPTPAQEARLYIDASWIIEVATSASGRADNDIAWLTAAIALNGRTIDAARVCDDGSLSLTTDTGITWSSQANRERTQPARHGDSPAGTLSDRVPHSPWHERASVPVRVPGKRLRRS